MSPSRLPGLSICCARGQAQEWRRVFLRTEGIEGGPRGARGGWGAPVLPTRQLGGQVSRRRGRGVRCATCASRWEGSGLPARLLLPRSPREAPGPAEPASAELSPRIPSKKMPRAPTPRTAHRGAPCAPNAAHSPSTQALAVSRGVSPGSEHPALPQAHTRRLSEHTSERPTSLCRSVRRRHHTSVPGRQTCARNSGLKGMMPARPAGQRKARPTQR